MSTPEKHIRKLLDEQEPPDFMLSILSQSIPDVSKGIDTLSESAHLLLGDFSLANYSRISSDKEASETRNVCDPKDESIMNADVRKELRNRQREDQEIEDVIPHHDVTPFPEIEEYDQKIRDIAEEIARTGRISDSDVSALRQQVGKRSKTSTDDFDLPIVVSLGYVVDRLNWVLNEMNRMSSRRFSLFVTHHPGKEPEFVVVDRTRNRSK
jgi:hypothetical protein